jgi:hypothetical protein
MIQRMMTRGDLACLFNLNSLGLGYEQIRDSAIYKLAWQTQL